MTTSALTATRPSTLPTGALCWFWRKWMLRATCALMALSQAMNMMVMKEYQLPRKRNLSRLVAFFPPCFCVCVCVCVCVPLIVVGAVYLWFCDYFAEFMSIFCNVIKNLSVFMCVRNLFISMQCVCLWTCACMHLCVCVCVCTCVCLHLSSVDVLMPV